MRPERGGEAGVVAPAKSGLGVVGVAVEVEDGLLEGAVCVGEEEVSGGGVGSEHGKEEELGELGDGQGRHGGGAGCVASAGAGQGPLASG
jgi:hypothetical protein